MSASDYRLFDTLMEGVHVLTPEWNYVYVSPASAEQFGLQVKDMLHKNMYDVFPEVRGSNAEKELKKTMLDRTNFDEELEMTFPNALKRWYDVRIRPVVEGILVMMLDVTHRKEQQLKLLENEQRYSRLFDSMVESYSIVDIILDDNNEVKDMRFVEINKATFALFGPRDENMIGKLRSELYGPMDEQFRQKINKVISTSEIVKYTREVPKLKLWVEVTLFKVGDDQMAVLSTDITKRTIYQKKLQRFNKKLEVTIDNKTRELSETLEREKALSQLQASFLSMASHELKAPLNSINVCLEVLNKDQELANNKNYAKYSGYIQEEMDNLLSLVTKFISPTNKILSEMGIVKESTDIPQLMSNVSVGFGELTSRGQKIVHNHKGPELVEVNKNILRRILTNLLSNAIKYSKKDIIVITKVCSAALRLEVIDKGIGYQRQSNPRYSRNTIDLVRQKTLSVQALGLAS